MVQKRVALKAMRICMHTLLSAASPDGTKTSIGFKDLNKNASHPRDSRCAPVPLPQTLNSTTASLSVCSTAAAALLYVKFAFIS